MKSHFIRLVNISAFSCILTSTITWASPQKNPYFVHSLGNEKFTSDHLSHKKTVCTVTINSDDEKNTFLKGLGQSKFEFVELTPETQSINNPPAKDWFKKACESGVTCDLLIISGHFGGTFFGASGLTLSMEDLESNACAKTCPGILDSPKEVFLFGCNTLAGKDKDSRTPEQYLRVLMNDGIPHSQAIQLVEARYGAFGSDNKARMQRTFHNTHNIYGFSSIGPSGSHVKEMLGKYLMDIGDYDEHLDKISRKNSGANNIELTSALKSTSFAQCHGIDPRDPSSKIALEICSLFRNELSMISRVKIAESLLNSQTQVAALPTILKFINSNLDDPNIIAFKYSLKKNRTLRDLVSGSIKKMTSPSLIYPWIMISLNLGWLEKPEADQVFSNKVLAPLFSLPLLRENVDLIISLTQDLAVEEAFGPLFRQAFKLEHFDSAFGGELASYVTFANLDKQVAELNGQPFVFANPPLRFALEILQSSQHVNKVALTNAIHTLRLLYNFNENLVPNSTILQMESSLLKLAENSDDLAVLSTIISTFSSKRISSNAEEPESVISKLLLNMPKSVFDFIRSSDFERVWNCLSALSRNNTRRSLPILRDYLAQMRMAKFQVTPNVDDFYVNLRRMDRQYP